MGDLDALEALLAAATPGPWEARRFDTYPRELWSLCHAPDEPPLCDDALYERDARAIAALRNVAPALIAVVRAGLVLLDYDRNGLLERCDCGDCIWCDDAATIDKAREALATLPEVQT